MGPMEALDSAGVTGIVWRRVDPAHEAEAEGVMREIMTAAREFPGFLGSEIFPPVHGVQEAYVVLYRFNTSENLRVWLNSARRGGVIGRIEPFLLQPPFEFVCAHRRPTPGTASSVFSYCVKPECEGQFMEWRGRILEECRKWEGFLGTESFDTLDCEQPEFVVVVRFDNRAHLDAWLRSKVRTDYLKEVRPYVRHYHIRRIGSGFEGWFDVSEDRSPPAAWRQGMVILAALFPVIMILRHLLGGVFTILPFPAAFLVLLTVDVTLLTYVIMPHFSRLMNFWLRPGPTHRWQTELAGWAILLGLLAVTLALALVFGV